MRIGCYCVFFVLSVIGRVVQSFVHHPIVPAVQSLSDIRIAVKNSKNISLKDSITKAVKKMSHEEIRQIIEEKALGAPEGKTQAQILEEVYTQIESQAKEVALLQASLQAILKSQAQAEAQEQAQSQTESQAQSERQALTQHEALAQLELAKAQALEQEIALTELESKLLAQALLLTYSGAGSPAQSQAQSQAQLQAQTQEQDQSSEQFQQIEEARVLIEHELTELGEAQNLIMEKLKYQTSALPQAIAIGPRTCNRCQETHSFSQQDIQMDSKLQTDALIQKYGYPSETHYANTEDRYRVCLHRIPRPGATPVMLVHGLMGSSASWVQFGPSSGLAYILYRKGFDVWMLNTRGNVYSQERGRGHESDQNYWDFSFHEIGLYDIPAAIDLILGQTNQPSIQYIGHSQGSTVFFAMCSLRPIYAAKVKLMQSLSPTVIMKGLRSPVLKFMGIFKGGFRMLLNLIGGYKISLKNKLIDRFRQHICPASVLTSRICAIFEFVVCGFNWQSFNRTLSPIVEGHASQGCSAKQLHHLAQMQGKNAFQYYDYGLLRNRLHYQSLRPPRYNLSLVTSKVALHHGGGDWLGSESDVTQLQQSLPNCIEKRKVGGEDFSHFDFTISQDVRPLVYDRVIDLCGTYR
ncbi:lipase 1-like [Drosophila subpulchrella]|uniref:lipase 1-like n=1 Tax=Drosophila subpulchrella TaxID=1486046 RepID=UPI0018A189DD|nr:lipase 1-like [Drosophila subpulchrella]